MNTEKKSPFNILLQVNEVRKLYANALDKNTDYLVIGIEFGEEKHLIKTKSIYLGHSFEQREMAELMKNGSKIIDPIIESNMVKSINSKSASSEQIKKRFVQRELKWNQGFYYNATDLNLNSFKIKLLGIRSIYDHDTSSKYSNSGVLAKLESQTTSENHKKEQALGQTKISIENFRNSHQRRVTDYEVALMQNGRQIGILSLNFSFYRGQQIIGSICTPNLSLVPMRKALEEIKPNEQSMETKTRGSLPIVQTDQRNIFSCCDQNEGVFEFMPPTFKHKHNIKE